MRYEATQGFDHDATGNRSVGDVFELPDPALGALLVGQGVAARTTKPATVILPPVRRTARTTTLATETPAAAAAKRKPGPKPGGKRASKAAAKAKPAGSPEPATGAAE